MQMHPNKDTQLCMSLSARPGNFGLRFHNHLYEQLGLNFYYKAFSSQDLPGAIGGIRALGVRGCGVSMPKSVVMDENKGLLSERSRSSDDSVLDQDCEWQHRCSCCSECPSQSVGRRSGYLLSSFFSVTYLVILHVLCLSLGAYVICTRMPGVPIDTTRVE